VLRNHPGDLPVPNRMTIDHALATIDESPLGERDVHRA
jgi:hypothetical protein